MLKTISSITNALGALNYKGTWNASSNTPTLADGTGAKGDYYVVSTAGTQTFGGVQLFFGTGDWIAYNGAVWQRVEGGSDGNFANVTLTSTDAGATAAPLLDLFRDSATPAASDTLGEIEFNGEDSAGNKQTYGVIHASILSPTSTAEQGQLHFETATAGALTEKMIIGTNNLVINEIGAVFNVRIEGDTDANLFYTDATNSRIGVGTISPAAKLDVVGTVGISSTTTLSGLTASTALALDASKNIVSVTNTGTGSNVLATGSTLVTTTIGNTGNFTDSTLVSTQSAITTGAQCFHQFKDGNGVTGAINSWGSAYGGGLSLAIGLSSNVLNDSSLGGTLQYGQTGFANMYRQYNGEHIFSSAASGTGGNNISFSTPLILDSSFNTKPGVDNAYSIGTAANRWSVVYSATALINTSDARTKQQVRDLDAAERSVAQKIKGLLKAFKFNDAVEAKGDGARIHFGVMAQDVAAAFASEGLDASRYALFCHDTWEDKYQDEIEAEQVGTDEETGEPIYKNKVIGQKLMQAAGDRYGIRYDELLAFVISAL